MNPDLITGQLRPVIQMVGYPAKLNIPAFYQSYREHPDKFLPGYILYNWDFFYALADLLSEAWLHGKV